MIRHFHTYVCLAALFFSSCNNGTANHATKESNTFIDDYGRIVEVPSSPTRIVSTSPAVTEIIFALGGGNLLIGRTDFCSYPAEAQKIESIGGISNLNVEKILSMKPDLVLSGSMIPKKSTLQMESMGVPTVCVIEQQDFDGLYDNISKIGRLINRTQEADSLVSSIKKTAQFIQQANADKQAPSVYYVVGFGATGNFTAGGNSFINDIITMAGGHNIAADITGWSYSLEMLMNSEPDFVVIRREDSATFCQTKPYSSLKAVREGRVIGIESGLIDLQVPRNIEAVKLLHRHFQ